MSDGEPFPQGCGEGAPELQPPMEPVRFGVNQDRLPGARMHCAKRWNIAPPDAAADELAARLKTSPLVAQVLLNRGVRELKDCQDFLRPSLKCLHDPFSIPNLRRAAERL